MSSYETALVTGASSGIGGAIAIALKATLPTVYGLGRNAKALAETLDGQGIEPLVGDITDLAALQALLCDRPVDILVNNAGILTSRAAFVDLAAEDIDRMIDVNLRATLQITRLCLRGMIERGAGHLLFIGSSAGRYPHPSASVYGASKAGISLFCDALRAELLGTRIRVTEIVPGRVRTRLYREAIGATAGQELYDGYEPLEPDNIASAVRYAVDAPPNVDVSRIEIFPVAQAVGGARMVKKSEMRG